MILLALLATLNPLSLFPDSTDIVVKNEITDANITCVHYLLAGGNLLTDTRLENPIPPGNSATFRVPFRYINRIIMGTDTKGNYRRIGFAPAPAVDTLSISRADKEFGGLFDVVHGERPFIITSSVPVPITSIFLRNDSTLTESLIGPNPLMTDETLFLWLNRHISDRYYLNRQAEAFFSGRHYLFSTIRTSQVLIAPDFLTDLTRAWLGPERAGKIHTFDLNREFPEIAQRGGFDAVTGNFIHTSHRLSCSIREYLQGHYATYDPGADCSVYMLEKSVNLLKYHGICSAVHNCGWTGASFAGRLRNYISSMQII